MVGAADGDSTSSQFWVDTDSLLVRRILVRDASGAKPSVTETRVLSYRSVGGYPVAHSTRAYRDGRLYFRGEATNILIAERLSEAKRTIPHFYLTIDCDVDALLAARRQANEHVPGLKLSVNDFVVRAAALALRKVPAVVVISTVLVIHFSRVACLISTGCSGTFW